MIPRISLNASLYLCYVFLPYFLSSQRKKKHKGRLKDNRHAERVQIVELAAGALSI